LTVTGIDDVAVNIISQARVKANAPGKPPSSAESGYYAAHCLNLTERRPSTCDSKITSEHQLTASPEGSAFHRRNDRKRKRFQSVR
jgi:hypothetical protein